jgi:magnesium chelatase family protein
VQGQAVARRVLEIAAAGGHHVLLLGEPGIGKTMLARRLPGLLPPLTPAEAVEASIVHSVAGLLDPAEGLLAGRPFRAPHHLVTATGLVGGGSRLRPGEASLAHRGVWFLDELGEFRPGVLDALRQPLETGSVRLVRATGAITLPAAFQLVAAMNGCPCGYVTSGARPCVCSEWQIRRYFRTVSGPLLDRIDMIHEMAGGEWTPADGPSGEASAVVAERVAAARRFHLERGQPGQNVALDLERGSAHCRPDDEAAALLTQAARQSRLSMRVCHRVLRVARTIADLAESSAVRAPHVLEALAHRRRAGEVRPAG